MGTFGENCEIFLTHCIKKCSEWSSLLRGPFGLEMEKRDFFSQKLRWLQIRGKRQAQAETVPTKGIPHQKDL